jgi:hypothetical protein
VMLAWAFTSFGDEGGVVPRSHLRSPDRTSSGPGPATAGRGGDISLRALEEQLAGFLTALEIPACHRFLQRA